MEDALKALVRTTGLSTKRSARGNVNSHTIIRVFKLWVWHECEKRKVRAVERDMLIETCVVMHWMLLLCCCYTVPIINNIMDLLRIAQHRKQQKTNLAPQNNGLPVYSHRDRGKGYKGLFPRPPYKRSFLPLPPCSPTSTTDPSGRQERGESHCILWARNFRRVCMQFH